MNRIFLSIFTFCVLMTCHAQITQVTTIDEVFRYFEEADANTLAVFDVDMVLIQPSEPAFQMANMKRFSPICKRIMKEIPEDNQMIFLSLTTIGSDSVLIDPRLPQLLQDLSKKGVPLMALTANLTGKLGSIINMEN